MVFLVGISCCSKIFGPNGLPNHAASDFCVRAVSQYAGAIPVLLPATGETGDPAGLLDRLDGILLTGSRTNIAPCRYGGPAHAADIAEDHARDATTLPLIRTAIARGTPILAICRGMQELNVALGGTLHQCLKDVPGRMNHAAAVPEDCAGRIAPAHALYLARHGLLHRLAGTAVMEANSLHHQGIDRLAEGLTVEARAPDGTIEAVRSTRHGFALGIQWHPEFDVTTNPISAAIFKAFGSAMRHGAGEGKLAAD